MFGTYCSPLSVYPQCLRNKTNGNDMRSVTATIAVSTIDELIFTSVQRTRQGGLALPGQFGSSVSSPHCGNKLYLQADSVDVDVYLVQLHVCVLDELVVHAAVRTSVSIGLQRPLRASCSSGASSPCLNPSRVDQSSRSHPRFPPSSSYKSRAPLVAARALPA